MRNATSIHLSPYSQTDYYGLAAFFTRVTTKRSSDFGGFGGDTVVRLKSSGSIRHPRSGEVVAPTLLGAGSLEDTSARDLRRPLAEWLTSPENPLFARNLVNRTWGYLMGVPLVQPIGRYAGDQPAVESQLLDALAADFVSNGYDLRELMRTIMTSRVFQLSSTATDDNAGDKRFFIALPRDAVAGRSHARRHRCGLRDAGNNSTESRWAPAPSSFPDPNFSSYSSIRSGGRSGSSPASVNGRPSQIWRRYCTSRTENSCSAS